jgi:guanosine-3',5'-bis(diphosphate) 3'-pyrophosphohydrolase
MSGTQGGTPASTVQRILSAARFAAESHATQRRKGVQQEPYVNHVLEVAELVACGSEIIDENLIIAALLHDTVEDTNVTPEDIRERFGEDVAALVAEVTDDKSLPKQARKALQVQNAPHKSVRAQSLKVADKISNLRSILASPPANWDLQRRRDYFDWAKRVVDGLTAASPILKDEFERVYAKLDEMTPVPPSGAEPPSLGPANAS